MFWRIVIHWHKGRINESIYEWKPKKKRALVDSIKVLMIPEHPSRVSQDTMIRKTKDSAKILMTWRRGKGWNQNTSSSLGVQEQNQRAVAD